MAYSLAQVGAMLDPHYAAKLQLIERHAEAGFHVANALDATRHQYRLAEMDRELSNRLTEMAAQHQLDGDKAIVNSIIKQMEERSAFRKDAAKMILEAAIKAKLGKIEHERGLEKQQHYLSKLQDYLAELCKNSREQEAKDYIDKLYREAMAGGL